MNLYQILEINYDSSEEDIKKSYFRLAKIYHPDKCSDPNANEKFQQINYAYNILKNKESRKRYNIINNKNDFHSLLEKIYNSNTINWKEVLQTCGINNISDNLIDNININDLIKLFSNNIVPKYKENNVTNCSESDTNIFDEDIANYYSSENLPLIYQIYNKNNINLELDIDFDKFINNDCRKIKINRLNKFDNSKQKTSFKFNLQNEYIVYHCGGDMDENPGHLIIKLNLPEDFSWNNNSIIYNYPVNIYQYMYGVKIKFDFIDKNIKVDNFIPYRDGNYLNTDIKLNNFEFKIKFELYYNHTDSNKKTLYNLCIS